MIKSFRHKGLEELFTKGKSRYLNQIFYKKLRLQLMFLDALNANQEAKILATPWRPHKLHGKNPKGQDIEGHFSFTVTGNWRLVFIYDNTSGDVFLTDFMDYH